VLASYLPRAADAAALLEEFIRKAKDRGANNETVRELYLVYAKALVDLGQSDQAEQILTALIGLYDEMPGSSWAVHEAEVFLLYAQTLHARGKLSEATEFYGKALTLQRQRLNPSHPIVVDTMSQYAGFLERTGDYRGALAIHQQLMEMWRKLDRQNSSSYRQGLLNTARLLLRLGAREEAVEAENEAIVGAQVQTGFTPSEWVDDWMRLLLGEQWCADKDWQSVTLRASVWCALFDHLLERPGGTGLCVDAIDWGGLRFRLDRWKAADGYTLIREGTFPELLSLPDPPQGVYRLSMEVPRPASKENQHMERWLLYTPWDVDVYGPTS
jgi:tetratricopeptide (TPR) repeat protein